MATFWKSKEFKEQQRIWNEKLKEAGFEDIEAEKNGEMVLKEPCSRFRGFEDSEEISPQVSQMAREEYYRSIWHSTQEAEFEDELDRLIMERTAEGKSIKAISEELKQLLPTDRQRSKFNRRTIRYVRRRYENKWGIRSWNPEQMTSMPPKRRRTR